MKKSFYVAGVQFRPHIETREAVKELAVGDILTMIPEPDNKFDPNAIRIIHVSKQDEEKIYFLGYVPKKFSSEISGLLEIGIELKCTVEAVNASARPWEMIKVTISDEEDLNNDLQGNEEEEE